MRHPSLRAAVSDKSPYDLWLTYCDLCGARCRFGCLLIAHSCPALAFDTLAIQRCGLAGMSATAWGQMWSHAVCDNIGTACFCAASAHVVAWFDFLGKYYEPPGGGCKKPCVIIARIFFANGFRW